MRVRTLPSLFAIAFMATSGVGGTWMHLCGMTDVIRTTCCCGSANVDAPVDLVGATDSCCSKGFASGEQPPAKVGFDNDDVNVFYVAVAAIPFVASSAYVERSIFATPLRGPPLGVGPPLYLLDCSFLI